MKIVKSREKMLIIYNKQIFVYLIILIVTIGIDERIDEADGLL
jgi:hypothetical protein